MIDRISQRFLDQAQALQKKLESLLEKDWGPDSPRHSEKEEHQLPSKLFEVQTDLSQIDLLSLALPAKDPERSSELFLRMHPYFEAGFYFSISANAVAKQGLVESFHNWTLKSAFLQGQGLRTEARALVEIALPEFNLTDIKKIPSDLIRSDLGAFAALIRPEWECLVLRVSEDVLWILFSNLPDLFLKDHIKTLHEKSLCILADFPEPL